MIIGGLASRPTLPAFGRPAMLIMAPGCVGQAFQPAGSGDFPVAGTPSWGWKAPLTGRLESLPYLIMRAAVGQPEGLPEGSRRSPGFGGRRPPGNGAGDSRTPAGGARLVSGPRRTARSVAGWSRVWHRLQGAHGCDVVFRWSFGARRNDHRLPSSNPPGWPPFRSAEGPNPSGWQEAARKLRTVHLPSGVAPSGVEGLGRNISGHDRSKWQMSPEPPGHR